MTLFDNVANENQNVNRHEAPQGFYAVCKSHATTPNVCASCDARRLCQENADGWCIKNRCMGYAVVLNDGTQVQRADGCGVFFKRV
jgi:hypothetical protein